MAWDNDSFLLLKIRAEAKATSWYVLQKKSTQRRKEFNLIGHLSSCLSRVSDAHHSGMWLQLEQKAFPVLKIIKTLMEYTRVIPGSY